MQCDSPQKLVDENQRLFQIKTKYEVQGVRLKMADFWIRPGIVTSNGNNRALTVEIEYAPSYFANDCWPLIKEFGDEIMHRHIDNKPPSIMENKQFQASFIVQQYVEIFSRENNPQQQQPNGGQAPQQPPQQQPFANQQQQHQMQT